jgi:hypothetical protein
MPNCICGHPRAVHTIGMPAPCGWREQTEGWSFLCDCSEFHASTKPPPAPESADSRFERQLAHSQYLESVLRERKARITELEKQILRVSANGVEREDMLQKRIADLERAQELRAAALRQANENVWRLQQRIEQAHGELTTQHGLLLENASTDDLLAEIRRRLAN